MKSKRKGKQQECSKTYQNLTKPQEKHQKCSKTYQNFAKPQEKHQMYQTIVKPMKNKQNAQNFENSKANN